MAEYINTYKKLVDIELKKYTFNDIEHFQYKFEKKESPNTAFKKKAGYILASCFLSILLLFLVSTIFPSFTGVRQSYYSVNSDTTFEKINHQDTNETIKSTEKNIPPNNVKSTYKMSAGSSKETKNTSKSGVSSNTVSVESWEEFYEKFPQTSNIEPGTSKQDVQNALGTPSICIDFNGVDNWSYTMFTIKFDSSTDKVIGFYMKNH